MLYILQLLPSLETLLGFSFCVLHFLVLKNSIDVFSSSEILSLAMSSLLRSPLESFFISVTVFYFLTSNISLWFFLRIFISVLTLFISFCLLSTLSIRNIIILIIVVLKFWSDYSHIPAMYGSDAYSVPSNFVCLVIFFS